MVSITNSINDSITNSIIKVRASSHQIRGPVHGSIMYGHWARVKARAARSRSLNHHTTLIPHHPTTPPLHHATTPPRHHGHAPPLSLVLSRHLRRPHCTTLHHTVGLPRRHDVDHHAAVVAHFTFQAAAQGTSTSRVSVVGGRGRVPRKPDGRTG